jgi:CRP-like cAMP-binding protein
MMLLLAHNGQRTSALEHYRSYRNYLARQLDISPEAATTDLYERIRTSKLEEADQLLLELKADRHILESRAIYPARLEQLKRVSLFTELPTKLLEEIVDLLEEVKVKAGQLIFEKGENGTCLYIIVEGRVRVFDGNRTINELAARDIFGEMAVLDAAPRLASVVALENTTLLRLEQATLYSLMAGRIEVIRAIVGVLSRRLRERVREVVELDTRLQTLLSEPVLS